MYTYSHSLSVSVSVCVSFENMSESAGECAGSYYCFLLPDGIWLLNSWDEWNNYEGNYKFTLRVV